MKISVAELRQMVGERQSFRFAGPAAALFGEGEPLWVDDPIAVEGEVVNNGRVLAVSGTIRAKATLVCNRCLAEYAQDVIVPFAEDYQKASDLQATDAGGDQAYYQGEEIDITDLVRETLLLAEPLKALCSEECKGFCAKCGANLNIAACDCPRDTIDPRLAGLQKLLNKE